MTDHQNLREKIENDLLHLQAHLEEAEAQRHRLLSIISILKSDLLHLDLAEKMALDEKDRQNAGVDPLDAEGNAEAERLIREAMSAHPAGKEPGPTGGGIFDTISALIKNSDDVAFLKTFLGGGFPGGEK